MMSVRLSLDLYKLFICQMKPVVGRIQSNQQNIFNLYQHAVSQVADICLLPELCLSGYMAEDLFLSTGFLTELQQATQELIAATTNTCLMLPTVININNKLYNGVIAAQYGQVLGISTKKHLPNYGIFDELRYFTPGTPAIISINGINVGCPICEDIWYSDVCWQLKNAGAQIFLVPNGSPYNKNKMVERISVVRDRFNETHVPIVYCNQVLGHDGIVFDGRTFCYDMSGTKIIGKSFTEDQQVVAFDGVEFKASVEYDSLSQQQEILDAIILALRDYVHHNHFKKVILGLSGGIDSAVVATIASMALGANNVTAYMLPSRYTSSSSLIDAKSLATNLGIVLIEHSIEQLFQGYLTIFNNQLTEGSIAYQNLQARIRSTILMAESNNGCALLLTTGNKSEYATGYTTIYGDMSGAFNPIKDLYKTEVYSLAQFINQQQVVIPVNILNKAPSAELGFNQQDTDSLLPYVLLDQILQDHIEHRMSLHQLVTKYDATLVKKVLTLVNKSEFKRKQSAPGVKISHINFEKDRRFPITNSYL